jgi:TetR/AcrR family transcriptional repressor of nem operon
MLIMLIHDDTRNRILKATRDLMVRSSYAETGVANICELAGVGKSSFYHYFPSKRDLVIAVLETQYADIKKGIVDQVLSESLTPLARLDRYCELVFQFQNSMADSIGKVPGCLFGSLAAEVSTQDESIRDALTHIFKRMEAMFRATLQEALELGEIRDIDLDATAKAMLAYMEGVMLLAKSRNDPEIISELLPAMTCIRIAVNPDKSRMRKK